MVNKTLVSGKYRYIDSSGTKRIVTFNNNGKITGFNAYSTYTINCDFDADDPDREIDDIIFNLYEKGQQGFGYVIKGKELLLYDIKNPDSTLPSLGKLRYKFSRLTEK